MSYVHGRVLKVIESRDGRDYLDIVARDDGLYEFRAYTREEKEGHWVPSHNSGLYRLAELAEADARRSLPWLFDEKSD